ncbi:MAG: hypothetical protein HRT35_15215 [Algicola sp.]|nr:hypothetical protein [Algicola sp.]
MNNLKKKAVVVAFAIGAGMSMSMSGSALAANGTCELFEQRCSVGMLWFCQKWNEQCAEGQED